MMLVELQGEYQNPPNKKNNNYTYLCKETFNNNGT